MKDNVAFLMEALRTDNLDILPAIVYQNNKPKLLEAYHLFRTINSKAVVLFVKESSDTHKAEVLKMLRKVPVSPLIVFATSALGVGVNPRNVRTVFHLTFPGSYMDLIQEGQRAGRDGKPSLHLVLCTESEVAELRQGKDGKDGADKIIAGDLMAEFLGTKRCRRKTLLNSLMTHPAVSKEDLEKEQGSVNSTWYSCDTCSGKGSLGKESGLLRIVEDLARASQDCDGGQHVALETTGQQVMGIDMIPLQPEGEGVEGLPADKPKRKNKPRASKMEKLNQTKDKLSTQKQKLVDKEIELFRQQGLNELRSDLLKFFSVEREEIPPDPLAAASICHTSKLQESLLHAEASSNFDEFRWPHGVRLHPLYGGRPQNQEIKFEY
ncbi:hypothetical protein HDU96_007349 [Phlyctochytrium bullatum]|nr:hypothetical protein HDU96_007349 [Phlyctochytrium bullatum]